MHSLAVLGDDMNAGLFWSTMLIVWDRLAAWKAFLIQFAVATLAGDRFECLQ